MQRQGRTQAIAGLEAVTHIFQSGPADLVATRSGRVRRQAQTGIVYRDLDAALDRPCQHFDATCAQLRLQAVPDGVLDQRLQQHRRNGDPLQLGGQVEPVGQPGPHAQGHDVEVRPQLGELRLQRRHLVA
ncbi:hypothetical protein AO062_14835 [Variovorax boronicumulans]|nr:hypothetical protein AO062_14835 [Variovorax boronicumulans]